jgi:hypothetical protein
VLPHLGLLVSALSERPIKTRPMLLLLCAAGTALLGLETSKVFHSCRRAGSAVHRRAQPCRELGRWELSLYPTFPCQPCIHLDLVITPSGTRTRRLAATGPGRLFAYYLPFLSLFPGQSMTSQWLGLVLHGVTRATVSRTTDLRLPHVNRIVRLELSYHPTSITINHTTIANLAVLELTICDVVDHTLLLLCATTCATNEAVPADSYDST